MSFWSIPALRTLLATETDSGSPGSEELVSQIRENFEALLMLLLATGASRTCTSDPSNDTNGYFYDTGAGWTDDQHNGRTLVMLSGSAVGNMYTIDDVVAASNRLACTGDNLYAAGVRSGDAYIITYDLKNNIDGHDHDGINSSQPVLANDSIVSGKLKTGTGSASGSGVGKVSIGTHDYSFCPNIYTDSAADVWLDGYSSDQGDYMGRFAIYFSVSRAYAVRWRYITASDEPFIYATIDKTTGQILNLWMADDPPSGFWGHDKTPHDFVRPIICTDKDGKDLFDAALHDEIISWKVPRDLWMTIRDRLTAKKKIVPARVMQDDFEYDKASKIWKSKNLIAA